MVTIKDVAERAGVSIKTVSRVTNDRPYVADETRQRVRQVIQELGYQPSALARSLVRGRSNSVGIVIPLAAHYVFSHPFFSEVLRGVAEVFTEVGLDLLLCLGRDDTPYVDLYQQRRVDGLILMSVPIVDPNLEGLLESGVPCVFTCRIAERDNPTHWVDADYVSGLEQSVEHLIHLGHTRIGLLAGPSNLAISRLRVSGYREILARYDIAVRDEFMAYGSFSFETGRQLTKKLMREDDPPTAFICGDDMMALGATEGLLEEGYRVPKDVSVIGFDDVIIAGLARPALTTVHQDAYSKGRVAASTLVERMTGSPGVELTQALLPTELIVRESTGPVSCSVR